MQLRPPNTTCFARHALVGEHHETLALIEPSLGVLDAMTEQIRPSETSIGELACGKYREVGFLTQIAGVGTITLLTFIF